MSYQFLRDLEKEIRPVGYGSSSWVEEFGLFTKLMSYSGNTHPVLYPPLCDIKFRLRGYAELSKWWKTFGLKECHIDRHVATWDEHRFQEAYDNLRMHQPFDMHSFLSAMDGLTGRNLIRFRGVIIPEWLLSPNYEYVDCPNALYKAMRNVWYGERREKKRETPYLSMWDNRYDRHQHHYFPYQPEPELWMFVAMNAKPSYVKGRLYAYNAYKDMSVLEERFLHSLVNLNITKANGKKYLWTAGKQS